MTNTSLSLLECLARGDDPRAWERLVTIYSPLLERWLRQYQVTEAEAADLQQEVYLVLMRELPRFEHSGRPGAFRHWLRQVVMHRVRDFWRRAARERPASEARWKQILDDFEGGPRSAAWDDEHRMEIIRWALEEVRPQFAPATWSAFTRFAIEGQAPEQVARDLGLSRNAVYIAKSRVLKTLRELAQRLIE